MDSEIVSIEFQLEWSSHQANHKDRLFIPRFNFWRDILPQPLEPMVKELIEKGHIEMMMPAGKLVESFKEGKRYSLQRHRIKRDLVNKQLTAGRFYPRGMLSEIGFAREDIRPFRIMAVTPDALQIDTNHPLSAIDLKLRAELVEILSDRHKRGGSSIDVSSVITDNGPGLQATLPGLSTDFEIGKPFARQNSEPDRLFYETPKRVNHVDEEASRHLSSIYAQFLKPGMQVLDLMSGWRSHISAETKEITVTGLGMNREEMMDNPVLSDIVQHDLNAETRLPFDDLSFDGCFCSLSIEYLTDPVAVFQEVGRVLAPGAPFILTFSDRWFEPKVIRLWTELHPFERMGLVTDFFQLAGCFSSFHTESVRGYPRPLSDSHINERQESDPIFAVWGFKA